MKDKRVILIIVFLFYMVIIGLQQLTIWDLHKTIALQKQVIVTQDNTIKTQQETIDYAIKVLDQINLALK